jgi:DNA-binding LacI/PurR family transcriptional regulator
VNQATPETARNLIHLLMQGAERPDALLIADDNLVEHATAGLVAAGVRVPDDLEVVAHCNFPHPTPSVLPVRRLGYDAREVMKACVESIDIQRRDGKTAPTVTVKAVFEDEIGMQEDASCVEG